MNAGYFIAIVLVSGFVAGTIHGAVNLAIVEPYLDEAISIENRNLFTSGEAEDTPQFWVEYNSYRDWQKSGQLLAGGILGMSIGALFGIVFAYSRNSLPEGHTVKKTFVLAAIMWFTIFLIPFLKYPAFVGYAVFITSVFFIMPPSPDEVTAPMDLVNGFRTMSVMAVTTFWIAEAIILGLLWQKYKTKLQEP